MPTRLKKYSSPIQVMPATKWIQRSDHQGGGCAAGELDLRARRVAPLASEVIFGSPMLRPVILRIASRFRSSARILHHTCLVLVLVEIAPLPPYRKVDL